MGRRPATADLGLDGTGVQIDERGFVVVDERCRTGEQGVWAVGDCVDTPALAHVGFAEGMVAIDDILGEEPTPIDYGKVPWGIYCRPEVAYAGHSEESAREAGYDVVASKHRYSANSRAKIIGDQEGLVKVIAEKTADGTAGTILGVHMVGPWVTEQLGQGYLAVNWEATVEEVAAFIQPHPTLSELFGDTVQDLTGRRLTLMADIQMPQLGETVTEGTITKWFKNVGDQVAEDEPLFEVSTDKVDSEVPSPVSGVVSEILVPEGDTVDVGVVLARVGDAPAGGGDAGPADAGQEAPAPEQAPPDGEQPAADQQQAPAAPETPPTVPPAEQPAAPAPAAEQPAPAAAAEQPAPAAAADQPAPAAPAPAARRAPPRATVACCRRSSGGSSPRTRSTRPPSRAPAPAAGSPATTC